MDRETVEKIIEYIENTELLIDIEKFFNKDGTHITKHKYGLVVLETLVEELKENFL